MSPSYLASDELMLEEFPEILQQSNQGLLKIYWVLVDDCPYDMTKLKDIQRVIFEQGEALTKIKKSLRASALTSILKTVTEGLLDVKN